MGRIFVAHGSDHITRDAVCYRIEKMGHEAVVFEPPLGGTVFDEFLRVSETVKFAIVVLTADDVGGARGTASSSHQPRARQNAVFELGYFIGKLGRRRVCALCDDGVELPSNYHGVMRLDPQSNWVESLRNTLREAGLEVASSVSTTPLDFVERTKSLIEDLRALEKAGSSHEVGVRFSGFLSSFAIGPNESDLRDRDAAQLVAEERRSIESVARAGIRVHCIVSPPGANMLDINRSEFAMSRVETLLTFLQSNDPAVDNVTFALSGRVERYQFIIGRHVWYEGFKSWPNGGGFDHTYRDTSRSQIDLEIEKFDRLFAGARRYALERFGDGRETDERALRAAVIRCLEQSRRFLQRVHAVAAATWDESGQSTTLAPHSAEAEP